MDETLDGLRRRLAVTGGKYGTWITCTEAAALLPVLERLNAVEQRMVEGPPEHRMIDGPQKTKTKTARITEA